MNEENKHTKVEKEGRRWELKGVRVSKRVTVKSAAGAGAGASASAGGVTTTFTPFITPFTFTSTTTTSTFTSSTTIVAIRGRKCPLVRANGSPTVLVRLS
ncbi:hypothetical protein M0804_001400 [Polistes exclamans]|nr:hypothetical protein M0804_001400 [Polistes exclamans]